MTIARMALASKKSGAERSGPNYGAARATDPPSLFREVVGLVVRLREQRIMERLKLERARFEPTSPTSFSNTSTNSKLLARFISKTAVKLPKKIRETMFGKYTKEQIEAAHLAEGCFKVCHRP
jgi:hypothetical protein